MISTTSLASARQQTHMINKLVTVLLVAITATVLVECANGHPGSGIVVDAKGNVFFQDSAAQTVWRIDQQGKLTPYTDKLGGHWMALDQEGKFARSHISLVERITPDGMVPTILVAAGGAPIAINRDGHLYYGLGSSGSAEVIVGLTKISPDGHKENFAADFAKEIEKLGVTGLACAPDNTIYAACLTQIMKVHSDGSFLTLVNVENVEGCDKDAPTCFLRGLDVDENGTVYVAACGCRCVLKVSRDGKSETVLKAERPWSPTGIALHGAEIYVLEYTNANGHFNEGWLPRVRRVDRDGQVTVLASISAAQQNAQPNRLNLPR